ncbi:MAG TPA: lysophospholipid acyltransferase family protein [Bacteroidales bacterium]|nr:lysophospholipid acyltransferase family protein [Bacteroidales bacterium]
MNLIRSISAWLTGIIFLVLFFPVTLVAWLVALPFDPGRKTVHRLIILQTRLIMTLMPVAKLKIEGREKATKGSTYVIISNHQSLLDILVINCLGYNFRWISKIENSAVPFLGWYLKMAGYITVDRNNDESKAIMLAKAYNSLRNGTSVMIFPEGTRINGEQPGYFKRGAFQLAIEAKVPILPVILDGTGNILPKHGIIVKGRNNILIRVLDPVEHSSFGTDDPEKLAARFRNIMSSELMKLRTKNISHGNES